MATFFLGYDNEEKLYLVKEEDEFGEVSVHSAFHKRELAQNTVKQLNERVKIDPE